MSDAEYYESRHRGTLILWLGVGSIIATNCCPFLGLGLGAAAWTLGNGDLERMAAREMDPAGRANTKAGKICGAVGFGLGLLYAGFLVAVFGIHFARGR